MQLEDFLPNICINLSNTKGIKDCENVPDQNKFKTRETKASTTKVIIDCETKKCYGDAKCLNFHNDGLIV